ncbi:MAG: hypothetical protein Q8L27_01540 [archaeon]|nr:hypothetical protein [archaeon]
MNGITNILLMILLATIVVYFYLKKNSALNNQGIKDKKYYLLAIYGMAIVFAVLLTYSFTNDSPQQITGNAILENSNTAKMTLKVNIPCPGHAPLIINKLSQLKGIYNVDFSFPNEFEVTYDSSIITKEEILSADIFSEYPAKEI